MADSGPILDENGNPIHAWDWRSFLANQSVAADAAILPAANSIGQYLGFPDLQTTSADPWANQSPVAAPSIYRDANGLDASAPIDANSYPQQAAPSLMDTLAALSQPSQGGQFSGSALEQMFGKHAPAAAVPGMIESPPTEFDHSGIPQYGMAGEGSFANHLASQIGGGQGGGYGGLAKPSDLERLIGLGAALLGGGNVLQNASAVNTFQNARAIQQQQLEQQAQLHNQALQRSGPAGQMQKQQRDIYESRMNGDVNRFIKAKSQDVNGTIPQEEWDRGWQQLRSQYAPLGLDPGPSPFEIQWEAAKEASPEFRNAELVKQTKEQYGDSEGAMMSAILSGDPKAQEAAQYRLKLESERTSRAKILFDHHQTQTKETSALLEDFRKRDLETSKDLGIGAGQITQAYGSKLMTTTQPYLSVQSAINGHYDQQQAALRAGTLAAPSQFFTNGVPAGLDKKTYAAFAKSVSSQSAAHGDLYVVPTAPGLRSANLPPEVKARAASFDDEATARKTLKIQPGHAVLVRIKGQLGFLPAQPAL